MERKSNFKYDNEVIGKVGENDFTKNTYQILLQTFGEAFFTNKIWLNSDVSEDEIFQMRDVDFVLTNMYRFGNSTENISKQLSSTEKCDILKGAYGDDAMRIEVKTDTRTYLTRNIVYEVISHYRGGCWATTEADIVYYVCVDENDSYAIKERFVIFVKPFREWIIRNQHIMSHKMSDIANKDCPIVMNVIDTKYKVNNKKDDPILNILVNIDELMKYNGMIVKEIKL